MTDRHQSPDDGPKREGVRSVASEIREYSLDNLAEVEHRDVSRSTGLFSDAEHRELMTFAEQAWDRQTGREDPEFHETQFSQDHTQSAATETATRAVRDGNLSQMEFMTGWPQYESDVSGLNTTRKIENWLLNSEQCKLVYLAGLMGRGKTDWLLSMYQIIHWHYARIREEIADYGAEPSDVPTPEFAANFAVDPEPEGVDCLEIDNYDDLVEWAERGSSDDERWYAFDEASTELTAQSGQVAQDVAEMFAPFVKKMRKNGINMIVVGHDKGDVHVAIRSMADFIAKPGIKKATVYRGIKNREPYGEILTLDRIPETDWGYSTDDLAEWNWGSATDGDDPDALVPDEKTLKRVLANRAAKVYENSDLGMKATIQLLSNRNTSISTTMLQNAIDGEYSEVSA